MDNLYLKNIKNAYVHQNYTDKQDDLDYDIAVAELESDFFEWSDTVKPACLDIERPFNVNNLATWSDPLIVSFF